MPRITIGLTVFDAYRDAKFTIQALRMYHILPDEIDAEILVIDNRPGEHGQSKMLRSFCEGWSTPESPIRYVPMAEPTGTSQSRNRIFEEAKGELVLVVDSHVLIAPGGIKRLIRWFDGRPGSMDLVQGPILWDNLEIGATQFDAVWGEDAMWGKWAKIDSAFDIPGMGLGMFACRKEAWQGFHPDARGFGGEELCYHEKHRRAGGRTLCLAGLDWWHFFTDPRFEKPAYPLTLEDKAANYVLWFRSLDWDLEPVRAAFVQAGKMTEAQWDWIVADPINHRRGIGAIIRTTGTEGPLASGGRAWNFPKYPSHPDEIPEVRHKPGLAGHKERIPQLQSFLDTCRTVTETVHRQGNDGGRPTPLAGETDFLFIDFSPPVPEVLRSLLDTMAGQARQYIALNDTHWPGLPETVTRWCGSHREWGMILHRPVEPGITLLRRDPNYTPPPGFGPGTELKGLLESIGIKDDPTCDCNAKMETMDRGGVEWCKANRETIVGWLKEGQGRWGWKDKIKATAAAFRTGLMLHLSASDPFGSLVDHAIQLAEKEATATA